MPDPRPDLATRIRIIKAAKTVGYDPDPSLDAMPRGCAAAVGRVLGVSRSEVNQWWKGKRGMPSDENLKKRVAPVREHE